MNNKFIILIILSFMCTLAQAQVDYSPVENNNYYNLSEYVVHVPAGIKSKVLLSQGINSNSSIVGQTVETILTQDIRYQNILVASAGSIVSGVIVHKQAARGSSLAKIMVKFTTIRTPYNNVIPINAVILTPDNDGIMKGATTEENGTTKAEDIIIPANTELEIVFNQPITLGAR